jgi:hypothetical protein
MMIGDGEGCTRAGHRRRAWRPGVVPALAISALALVACQAAPTGADTTLPTGGGTGPPTAGAPTASATATPTRGSPTPTGGSATPATPHGLGQLPPDADLLAQCVARIKPQDRAVSRDVQLLDATADDQGYLVWIGGARFNGVCASRWGGAPDERSVLGLPIGGITPGGYLTGTGGVDPQAAGTAVSGSTRALVRAMEMDGTVSRDVRRVLVRCAGGRPPTEASVRRQYFLARRIEPEPLVDERPSPTDTGCRVEGYDAAGVLVASHRC